MIGEELRKLNRLQILELMLKERSEKDVLQIELNRIKRAHPELDGIVPEEKTSSDAQPLQPESPVHNAKLTELKEIRDSYEAILSDLKRQMRVLQETRSGSSIQTENLTASSEDTDDIDDEFQVDFSDVKNGFTR